MSDIIELEAPPRAAAPRLTSLAHGGGCGCKLAPSVLQQLLADHPAAGPYKQLLVGTETGDDAAVWQVSSSTCQTAASSPVSVPTSNCL